MIDAAWIEVLENLLVDSVILCAKEDNLSDEEIAEYEQRGVGARGRTLDMYS